MLWLARQVLSLMPTTATVRAVRSISSMRSGSLLMVSSLPLASTFVVCLTMLPNPGRFAISPGAHAASKFATFHSLLGFMHRLVDLVETADREQHLVQLVHL